MAVTPQRIVLDLKWAENGQERQDLFGPWIQGEPGTEEGSMAHMMAAHAFLGEWRRLTGRVPHEATVILIQDPDEWVRQQKGSDDG